MKTNLLKRALAVLICAVTLSPLTAQTWTLGRVVRDEAIEGASMTVGLPQTVTLRFRLPTFDGCMGCSQLFRLGPYHFLLVPDWVKGWWLECTSGPEDNPRRQVTRLAGFYPKGIWVTLTATFSPESASIYINDEWNAVIRAPQEAAAACSRLHLGGAFGGIRPQPFEVDFVRQEAGTKSPNPQKSQEQAIQTAWRPDAGLEDMWIGSGLLRQKNRCEEAEKLYKKFAKRLDSPPFLRADYRHSQTDRPGIQPWVNQLRAEPDCTVYVSPKGTPHAKGTPADPVDGLPAALKRLKALARLKALSSAAPFPSNGSKIVILPGQYEISSTFCLTEADSRVLGPLAIVAEKRGSAVFTLARPIQKWRALTAEEKECLHVPGSIPLEVANLAAEGIPALKREFPYAGWRRDQGNLVVLASGTGQVYPEARYPQSGFLFVDEVISAKDGVFRSRPAVSKDAFGAVATLQATGYWAYTWLDQTFRLKMHDAPNTVQLLKDTAQDLPAVKKGTPFFLKGSPSFIGRPGDWAYDPATSQLWMWRPPEDETIAVSTGDFPLMRLERVQKVVLDGLVLEGGRRDALQIANSEDILVENCTIRGFGKEGVNATGTRLSFVENEIYAVGSTGIDLAGGARKTLKMAENVVEKNKIHETGQYFRTYSPAVRVEGCGARIAENEFSDLLSSAIRIDANEVLVASNTVKRVVLESDDQGGIDIWGDPAYAGIDIVGNTWSDIGNNRTWTPTGAAAVRLDDGICGVAIRENTFERCGAGLFGAVQINGGRCNWVYNNTFKDCAKDLTFQKWDDARWQKFVKEKGQLVSLDLYRTQYPHLQIFAELSNQNYFWANRLINVQTSFEPRWKSVLEPLPEPFKRVSPNQVIDEKCKEW